MKILWLGFAEEDLDSIYQFYADNNSRYFANKLYNQILDTTDNLIHFPRMGPIEWDLSEKDEEYRSLLVRKYFKIIYFIENENIYIAAVWDCRQDPYTNINKIK